VIQSLSRRKTALRTKLGSFPNSRTGPDAVGIWGNQYTCRLAEAPEPKS